MKAHSTLHITADTLLAVEPLRNRPQGEIREALKLLVKSNPQLVMFLLYELATIYEEQS